MRLKIYCMTAYYRWAPSAWIISKPMIMINNQWVFSVELKLHIKQSLNLCKRPSSLSFKEPPPLVLNMPVSCQHSFLKHHEAPKDLHPLSTCITMTLEAFRPAELQDRLVHTMKTHPSARAWAVGCTHTNTCSRIVTFSEWKRLCL